MGVESCLLRLVVASVVAAAVDTLPSSLVRRHFIFLTVNRNFLVSPSLVVIICLYERIGDLLAAVQWRYQNKQCSSSYQKTQAAGASVSFLICVIVSTLSCLDSASSD